MGEEEENRADSSPEGAVDYFRTLTQRDRSRAGNSSAFLSCCSHLTRGRGRASSSHGVILLIALSKMILFGC